MSHRTRRLKRWVVVAHLYLGVALSLLSVMWFASGVVLMYAPFPGFSQARQDVRGTRLDCSRCSVALAEALSAMHHRDPAATVRLGMLLDRPVYRFLGTDRRWHALFADDASAWQDAGGNETRLIAARYAALGDTPVSELARITEPDQWTVEAVLRNQLPLFRVDFADASGTRVYVSAAGGEAITSSTRRERLLAWIGAIPHWLYPRMLRSHLVAWRRTIITIAALGVAMSLTGLAIGVWQLRWRRRAKRSGHLPARSPYRTRWMRWHHYLGLFFGVITFTWFLSGLLSIDPSDWSPGDGPTAAEQLAFAGGDADGAQFTLGPADAARRLSVDGPLHELRATMVGGKGYWVGSGYGARPRLVSAATDASAEPGAMSLVTLADAAVGLVPGARIVRVDTLRAYDDFYYPASHRAPLLPVLRVRFDDREHRTFYLDPRTGAIALREVTRSRLERWLYTGLHDLDFRALYSRRPLWDAVMLFLSLGGLALATTGVAIGWKWLTHQRRR